MEGYICNPSIYAIVENQKKTDVPGAERTAALNRKSARCLKKLLKLRVQKAEADSDTGYAVWQTVPGSNGCWNKAAYKYGSYQEQRMCHFHSVPVSCQDNL